MSGWNEQACPPHLLHLRIASKRDNHLNRLVGWLGIGELQHQFTTSLAQLAGEPHAATLPAIKKGEARVERIKQSE